MNDKAIVLKGIRKAFAGHVAVKDLSLEVPRGSVFGLLGPNGAGKTTTLRMVMNILGPDAGTIEILGQPADHAARDRIGYMPEERGLYPRMVLEEQLVFMAAIKGMAPQGGREAARPLARAARARRLAEEEDERALEGHAAEGAVHRHRAARAGRADHGRADERPRPRGHGRDARGDAGPAPQAARPSSSPATRWRRSRGSATAWPSSTAARRCSTASVSEVKARHGKNTVVLAFDGDGVVPRRRCPASRRSPTSASTSRSGSQDGADPQPLLREAAARLRLRRFEIVEPSLHDIFVETVTGHGKEAA